MQSSDERLRNARGEHARLLTRLGRDRKTLSDSERTSLIEQLTIVGQMILALKAERAGHPRAPRTRRTQAAE